MAYMSWSILESAIGFCIVTSTTGRMGSNIGGAGTAALRSALQVSQVKFYLAQAITPSFSLQHEPIQNGKLLDTNS